VEGSGRTLKLKRKVDKTCVKTAMVYGGET
jgi:hypothetical protein